LRQVLHDVGGGDDASTFDQIGFGYAARLGAGAAGLNLAAIAHKLLHHILEHWKAFFLHTVGAAPLG
jgi:hypothetical protein